MATKIDEYVKAVLSCANPYDVGKLVNDTFPNGQMQLPSDTVDMQIDASLQALNIAAHSPAILPLLHARLQLASKEKQALIIMQIVDLVEHAEARHLQQIVQSVFSLMSSIADLALNNESILTDAISLLDQTIRKIQVHPNQLTSIHSLLLCLSLKARHFDFCYKYIDQPITDILRENPHPNEPAISPQSVLSYFYYAAMIFTALEEYDRALINFAVPLYVPGNALSKIAIDCYKKYTIVSLIARGSTPMSGIDTQCQSSALSRTIRQQYQAYTQLVDVVNKHPVPALRSQADRQQLDSLINSNRELFAADGNLELVERIRSSLIECAVKSICEAYSNIDLTTLQHQSGCDSITSLKWHVQSLIDKKQLIARFDHDRLIIDNVPSTSVFEEQAIESKITDILPICKLLADTQAQIKVDPIHVSIVERKSKQHGGNVSAFPPPVTTLPSEIQTPLGAVNANN